MSLSLSKLTPNKDTVTVLSYQIRIPLLWCFNFTCLYLYLMTLPCDRLTMMYCYVYFHSIVDDGLYVTCNFMWHNYVEDGVKIAFIEILTAVIWD